MVDRVLGVLLALALGAHAASKGWAQLDEMLWLCHVASLVLAIGLCAGVPRLVATGFLLHVAWGWAMWAMDVIATGTTTPTSVAVHGLPLIAGVVWLRRHRWPRGIPIPAWVGYVALVPLSRLVTREANNVNATYAVWPPFVDVVPAGPRGLIVFWIVTALLCLAAFLVADWALRRWDRVRRAPP